MAEIEDGRIDGLPILPDAAKVSVPKKKGGQ
jgi:hypothetical protein